MYKGEVVLHVGWCVAMRCEGCIFRRTCQGESEKTETEREKEADEGDMKARS